VAVQNQRLIALLFELLPPERRVCGGGGGITKEQFDRDSLTQQW
jgi:hypothetical protein